MAKKHLVIDPITKLGHLRIEAIIDENNGNRCPSSSTMFRG